ncbi:MAG: AAA family ATPase, partial [Deinococcota bacterium]|nr:AAA family ATPase [Deinococcota bacterium]
MPTCPQLPDGLRLWVDDVSLQPSSGLEPTLKPVIHVAAPESPEDQADAESEVQLVAHKLEDHPEIQTAWEAYLEVWLPWSQEYLRWSAVQGLYHQLFDAYDKLKQQRETLELVVGFGLYSTQVPRVRRHVFTAKAELHFNSDRGIMSLRCPQPPEGADLSIEDDFLANRPMQADYASVRNRLAEIGDAVWGRDLIIAALTRWSNLLGPDTHFSDALTPASEATAQPSLHFAPALILRRRGLQGLVRTYQSIIDQVSDGGGALPLGLERLVDHVDDTAASGFGPGQDPGGFRAAEHQDVYFPLPTNDEQRRIIENLGRRRGILVQGPPGTGKSHTIANLICHLLATGQRVLVTSETPRALSVLKEKLPDAVKPLCVSLLGASREAFDELSASVNGITTRHSNPQDYPVIIRRLEADLNETREKRANNYKRLLELREAETHPVTVAGGKYRGTAAVIARTINREEANLGWISRVRDPHEEPPLTALEAQELLHAHRALSRERRGELELAVVPVDSLLTAEQFAGLIRAERTAQRYSESFADVQRDPLYPSLERVAPERLADLTSALEGFQGARDAIRNRPEPWLPRAEADILGGRAGAWQSVFTQTKEGLASFTIDDIRLADRVTLALPQEVPRHRVLDDAKAISDHLNAGGKWRRFGFLTAPAKERDYLRKSVRVDDRPADTSEALRKLILVLSVEITLARLSSIWQAHAEAISGPYETQAIELAENLHSLEQIMELAVKAREIRRLLEENEPRLPIPNFAGERPAELYRLIRAVEAERSFKQSREAYRDVQGALRTTLSRPNTHPLNQALLDALEARDVQAGASARSELEGLEADRRRAVIAQGLQGRLASVAPEAARRLEETAHNEAWPERLEALQDAWHWGRAKHWLREREE